ncbi:hypothetical protein CPAV1605_503 [seawater metagenome]|uniref:Uncharacterized protein n=1 Tax=seawater metagenome TaxID=1561972 RepID=A0A5E8CH91_9ZZZZ
MSYDENIYFYIMYTENPNFFKFGCTKDLMNEAVSISDPDFIFNLKRVFKITETNEYKLKSKIDSYDKIISEMIKNDENIQELEKIYNTSFWSIKHINKFLFKSNLFRTNGEDNLLSTINNVFPLLGLQVESLDEKNISKINYSIFRSFFDSDVLLNANYKFKQYHKIKSKKMDFNQIQISCAGIKGWCTAFEEAKNNENYLSDDNAVDYILDNMD